MTYIEISQKEIEQIEAKVDRWRCYNGMEKQRLDLIQDLIQEKMGIKNVTVCDRENIGLRSGLRVEVGQELNAVELVTKQEGFTSTEYSKLTRSRVPNQDFGNLIDVHPETGKIVSFHQNGNISASKGSAHSHKYYNEITSVWGLSPNYKIKIIE